MVVALASPAIRIGNIGEPWAFQELYWQALGPGIGFQGTRAEAARIQDGGYLSPTVAARGGIGAGHADFEMLLEGVVHTASTIAALFGTPLRTVSLLGIALPALDRSTYLDLLLRLPTS